MFFVKNRPKIASIVRLIKQICLCKQQQQKINSYDRFRIYARGKKKQRGALTKILEKGVRYLKVMKNISNFMGCNMTL